MAENKNLPKIKDIYEVANIEAQDALMVLMNQPPLQEWVKTHPFIKGYKYLPIERIEYLLKSIFKNYKIEVTGQGQSFNGVWVTVRVHYINPVTNEWSYHDGIGAAELQLRAKTADEKRIEEETGQKFRVPFSTENINNGAITMAYPLAKTTAIKDACDHFGKLFGSDLNRKDYIEYNVDLTLTPMDENHPNWVKVCEAVKSKSYNPNQVADKYTLTEESRKHLTDLYNGTI